MQFRIRLLSKYIKIKTYKTIIVLVPLYGCGTWSHTMSDEDGLRRIFGPKKKGWSEKRWRKPHKEELHRLYTSQRVPVIRVIKLRKVRWDGHVARIGTMMHEHDNCGWKA
jgi:hypothetical protein